MPADPGSRRILVNSALLEFVDLPTRKFSHFVPQVGNKIRKSIRSLHGMKPFECWNCSSKQT
jgi:hypothetical protein